VTAKRLVLVATLAPGWRHAVDARVRDGLAKMLRAVELTVEGHTRQPRSSHAAERCSLCEVTGYWNPDTDVTARLLPAALDIAVAEFEVSVKFDSEIELNLTLDS
jgi:hypothetical protein